MKCVSKYSLMALLLITATVCRAGEIPVKKGPVNGIFYQPWQADLSLTRTDWERRMAGLRQDGLDTLYLQWLRHGEIDFLNARLKTGQPFIQVLLDAADSQGIGIYMGLFSDPGFFDALNLTTRELDGYLLKLREKNLQLAKEFQARYGGHPAFRGWYLPEEIDDLNWQSAPRRKILEYHMHHQGDALKSLGCEKPVAFSTFFSGALTPEEFAQFCRQLLEGSDHFLLVQDGLGGRMDIATTRRYHASLRRIVGKQDRLCWIVELFDDELPGPAFSGKAIEPLQLNQRLAIVHKEFKGKRLVLFSLRYWLDKKDRLSQHYRRRFQNPVREEPAKPTHDH
ncbi:MAG: hypothetical protein B6240_12250 [Desulfobacteraceae bacterium 4572_87]|nr:MAG: hypothetical protein B6240_12250 [Desulfobacteraceae bacterium 4572_87]